MQPWIARPAILGVENYEEPDLVCGQAMIVGKFINQLGLLMLALLSSACYAGSPVAHVYSVPYAEVSANECGPRYSMFKKIFSAKKVQQRWVAIFKAEVLHGYDAAIRPVKGQTQARSSRSKLVRLIDVELPQAISSDGGLRDIVSCWYSLNYEGISTTELEQLLRFDIDGLGFGTQTIGWLASDWCEKRFWPRFIEKHHSSMASYESPVEFRPVLWCGGSS